MKTALELLPPGEPELNDVFLKDLCVMIPVCDKRNHFRVCDCRHVLKRFIYLTESYDLSQSVEGVTHCSGHTLALLLMVGSTFYFTCVFPC